MTSIKFPVECPKCGSKEIHLPADSESGGDGHLTCGGCGYRAVEVDFVAKPTALDEVAQLMKDRLAGIPGFRKK